MNAWLIIVVVVLILLFFLILYIYIVTSKDDPYETNEYCSVCNKDTYHHRGKCVWCGGGKHWDYNR